MTRKSFGLVVALVLLARLSLAVPAYPGSILLTQPDGSVFEARQFGDEWYHWTETADGYVIQKNQKTRAYEYAVLDANGEYKLSGAVVGRAKPDSLGLTQHLRENRAKITATVQRVREKEAAMSLAPLRFQVKPSSGTVNNLVLLYDFRLDREPQQPQGTPTTGALCWEGLYWVNNAPFYWRYQRAMFDELFNGVGTFGWAGVEGSVWDYFKEVSYGKLDLMSTVNEGNDTTLTAITEWLQIPCKELDNDPRNWPPKWPPWPRGTHAYYASQPPDSWRWMIIDAIDLMYLRVTTNPTFDFTPFLEIDPYTYNPWNGMPSLVLYGLDVIHIGQGQEYTGDPMDIWSHKGDFFDIYPPHVNLRVPWGLPVPPTRWYGRDGGGVHPTRLLPLMSAPEFFLRTYHTEPESFAWPKVARCIEIPTLVENTISWDITRIGTICHETLHGFGVPDLYDYTYTSFGVGDWCIMGSGSWNAADSSTTTFLWDYYGQPLHWTVLWGLTPGGQRPAHPSAWIKAQLDWVNAHADDGLKATSAGIRAMPPVEFVPSVVRINMGPGTTTPTEYLLVENRQKIGFDDRMTTPGLLIWHVDETIPNNDNSQHYKVALLQADGLRELERAIPYLEVTSSGMVSYRRSDPGDPFPGTSYNHEIGPNSPNSSKIFNPNTNSYYGGDTNIWIQDIYNPQDPLSPMFPIFRFLPDLYMDTPSSFTVTRKPPLMVTFSNGSQRLVTTSADPCSYSLYVWNRDDNWPFASLCEKTGPFNIEFLASQTGGLTFDYAFADMIRNTAGVPGSARTLIRGVSRLSKFLPDGAYTPTIVVDRMREVQRSYHGGSRWAAPRSNFLFLRKPAQSDLAVYGFSFGPNWARPGSTIRLGGYVVNQGTATTSGPFRIEFWGSLDGANKFYPTKDFTVCDSITIPNLMPGARVQLSNYTRTLKPVPSHLLSQTFSIVCFADSTDLVSERNETNNYQVVGPVSFSVSQTIQNSERIAQNPMVEWELPPAATIAGKRALQPDLTVRSSTITLSGQPAPSDLKINVTVHNWGQTAAGSTRARVYLSTDQALSANDYRWADLPVPLIPANAERTATLNVGAPPLSLGAYCMLVKCDALSQVVESNENNNVLYAGPVLVGPDLAFEYLTYSESAPRLVPDLNVRYSEPGTNVTVYGHVVNRGIKPAGAFWLELWGSRTGGLFRDVSLFGSRLMSGLGPLGHLDISGPQRLSSVRDGRYTLTGVLDPDNRVGEVYERNNRASAAGKQLVELRPIRRVNLRLPVFRFGPNPVRRGGTLQFSGSVLNEGSEYSGPFWIEFFGSTNVAVPSPDFALCEGIYVPTLPPGGVFYLTPYTRTLNRNVPTGQIAAVCVVDRLDAICEPDESDNYKSTPGITVLP
jgi:hypothetical protein